ncbi:hypothetical protein SUGI_1018180 [Cryptomeria japonica]|nr:hypothetical protein SUGI_1018180 [Cryptomeria japonica]
MATNMEELNTGKKMPNGSKYGRTEYGKQNAVPPHQYEEMKTDVEVGYRHFDTASYYGSEGTLGGALKEAFQSGHIKREEVFVTTKLWDDKHDDPLATITKSLKNLQLEYVDLYLLHWHVRLRKGHTLPPKEEDFLPLDIKSTWQGMEKCFELGLTKAIGVSNFSCKKIEDLLKHAKIPTAANQVNTV